MNMNNTIKKNNFSVENPNKTKLCTVFLEHGVCFRKICGFAHHKKDLNPKNCNFNSCYRRYQSTLRYGQTICMFKHINEDIDEWYNRTTIHDPTYGLGQLRISEHPTPPRPVPFAQRVVPHPQLSSAPYPIPLPCTQICGIKFNKVRTKLCRNRENCPNKIICTFAHVESDLECIYEKCFNRSYTFIEGHIVCQLKHSFNDNLQKNTDFTTEIDDIEIILYTSLR